MDTKEKVKPREVLGCIALGIVIAAIFVLRIIF